MAGGLIACRKPAQVPAGAWRRLAQLTCAGAGCPHNAPLAKNQPCERPKMPHEQTAASS